LRSSESNDFGDLFLFRRDGILPYPRRLV